ncbi:proteasome component M29 [Exophiala oligosperma]
MADWITPPDPEREYNLISQLELRIASAPTDEKFESIIQKFLPALLLKLATSAPKNRELATKVCTYVYQRVKISSDIQVPVAAVVKTYSEAKIAGVVQFSLLFLTLGLPRLKDEQAVEALSSVLQSVVPKQEAVDPAQLKPWALVFDFLLDVLRRWKVPERGSKEEQALKEKFALTPGQTDHLAWRLGDWVLHDPKNPSNPGSVDFHSVYDKNYKRRAETIPPLGKFLFTSIFEDRQRFIPAVIMSVDANASAASVSDVMFKQCHFDLEDDENVAALFTLHNGAPTKLRTRILTLLSRSQKATSHPERFVDLVRQELDLGSLNHGPTPSALEKSKLHAALFSYLMWVVRVGPSLGNVSDEIQGLMKDYIDSQGWPVMQDRTSAIEIELRGKAYESIGLLAVKKDQQRDEDANNRMLDLIVWLFASLGCDTTAGIRSSIEEAIGRIMNTVVDLDESSLSRFKTLLLWNMMAQPGQEDTTYSFPIVNSTKYPAVRFANKCLPFSDIDARFINIMALDTTDRREVAEEGLRGLGPYWHATSSRLSGGDLSEDGKKLTLPRFETVVERFFTGSRDEKELYESTTRLASAIGFCRNVLVCNALEGTTHRPEESTDWQQGIDALVNNDKEVRERIRRRLREVDTGALLTFLKMALRGASRDSGECLEVSLEVLSLSPNGTLSLVHDAALAASSSVIAKPGLQLRAARIFGIVSSTEDDTTSVAKSELEQARGWNVAVGEQAIKCQGQILRACFCLTRSLLRGRMDGENSTLQALTQLVCDIIKSSSDKSMKDTAYRSLRQVILCTAQPSMGPPTSEDFLNPIVADAKKESEIAVSALGPLLGVIHARGPSSEFESLFSRVLALHEIKRAEFHFALGEALAVACAGWRSSSTMTEFDVDAELPSWGYSEDLMLTVLEKVLENCKTTKPALKKASAIWLLCLIQYCGDSSAVLSKLRECQATFTRLLNDRDEIVQETGSRGLSLVYERGDKALREDLVRDLVQSFTGSNAKMSGTVNEDTQLFEAGALPTEKGESVTTYKDIVRLATEMGDPSLVYKFMNLASSNAIWSSRAAFGRFGLGNILADSTYLAENKKFYPKLFRYRFDPNPNVQRSMNEIWRALVKDPSAVINNNFDLIMEDLLKSIVSGKEWRAREASCAAISDLVQGRDVDMFEKHLDEIWKVAFKVLDDVKETVRVAAIKLCRTLTSMLIRNLETGDGNTKRSATMLSHAMPFLIQQMEGGAGQDVQQYAIATLLEIVKKSPPKALRSYAPQILETLIVSLSSLEHESINYLHLNADKYGLTTEKLDKMRVSSINASPVTEAIEQCLESITMQTESPDGGAEAMEGVVSTSKPNANQSSIDDAMQRLLGAYRAAIGLPSKVGLSRVMITLVVRHPTAFRPYVDRFVQVTRKHVLDRNATISVAFSTSLGYLMRLASDKEIQATSEYAQKLYFESQELVHRSVAGEIVQAISKASNDVFMKSASRFLPFAFIGRQDTDKEVKERFDVPWKDNVGGSRSINLYLTEIVSLVSSHIKSTLWPIKHACCFAVADMVSSMDSSEKYSESTARLIWKVVQEALDGKTWAGKEEIIKAYPKFVEQARSIWSDNGVSQQMRKIAIREAKRTNVAYRPHAIEALGEFVFVRNDLDLSQDVVPFLADTLDELTDKDAMDIDETSGKTFENKTVVEASVGSIVSCLFRILASSPNAEVLKQSAEIVKKAQAMKSYVVDLAVYENANVFVKKWPIKRKLDAGVDVEMNGAEKENASASNGALASPRKGAEESAYERFEPLVLAVLAAENNDGRQGSEPENVRRERVALAVALAERGTRVSAPLAAILTTWARTERSRLLREDIQRAQLLL